MYSVFSIKRWLYDDAVKPTTSFIYHAWIWQFGMRWSFYDNVTTSFELYENIMIVWYTIVHSWCNSFRVVFTVCDDESIPICYTTSWVPLGISTMMSYKGIRRSLYSKKCVWLPKHSSFCIRWTWYPIMSLCGEISRRHTPLFVPCECNYSFHDDVTIGMTSYFMWLYNKGKIGIM